jgi:hypothetical protein
MDDNKLKAEFPIGKRSVIVTEPAPGQMFVLALSRKPAPEDATGREKLVRRLLRVLEALIGEQQWYDVIEEGMIMEEITPDELVKLAGDVMQFNWAEHRDQEPEQASPDPFVEPVTRPVPRIVSGG